MDKLNCKFEELDKLKDDFNEFGELDNLTDEFDEFVGLMDKFDELDELSLSTVNG